MINNKRLVSLLQKLVSINSENPTGNEAVIARYVAAYMRRLGLATKIYEFKRNRPNVVSVLRSRGSRHSLLITPHLDTVPAGKSWTRDPFAGKVINGKLYGLGATDCKSNLACAMEAIESIVEDNGQLRYNLVFAATADEESGSNLGLIPLLDKGLLHVDAALVLDADDFDIIVAQKGLMHLKVIIQGKRSHGAYPWRGVNAIDIAVMILADVRTWKLTGRANKYLRAPTINTGTIHGGDKVNIVADWCEFELDFRFLPGMNAQAIIAGLKAIIRRHAKKFRVHIDGVQEPYGIGEDHALVQTLMRATRASGSAPRIRGSEGATVITFFQHKGIPAIAWGCGYGGCAHIADEYVGVKNLCKGAKILEKFLTSY